MIETIYITEVASVAVRTTEALGKPYHHAACALFLLGEHDCQSAKKLHLRASGAAFIVGGREWREDPDAVRSYVNDVMTFIRQWGVQEGREMYRGAYDTAVAYRSRTRAAQLTLGV